MADNLTLQRPEAGQNSTLSVGPDARLEFTFNQGDADLSKDGQNLVFTFNDGATLTLEGFYNNFGDNAQPPTLIVEGNELPGEAFLAALNNPDLMPAAGPAAGPPMGGGLYEDALLAGVGGVDRLDKLEFDGWTRTTQVAQFYQSLSAAETAASIPPPTITFRIPDMGTGQGLVYESHLKANLNNSGGIGNFAYAHGSFHEGHSVESAMFFDVNTYGQTLTSLTIGNATFSQIPDDGSPQPLSDPIQTAYGEITGWSYDAASGELVLYYTLLRNAPHEPAIQGGEPTGGFGGDTSASDSIFISVSTAGGSSAGTGTVTIMDDAPELFYDHAVAAVSETDLPAGTDPHHNRDDVIGNLGNESKFVGELLFTYGADGPADPAALGKNPFTWIEPDQELKALVEGEYQPVHWAVSEDGLTLIGYVGDPDNPASWQEILVLEAALNKAGAAYSIELKAPLEHADPQEHHLYGEHGLLNLDKPEYMQFTLNFEITDSDGDTANGDLTVKVRDDLPCAGHSAINDVVSETSLHAGQIHTYGEMFVNFGADGPDSVNPVQWDYNAIANDLDGLKIIPDLKIIIVDSDGYSYTVYDAALDKENSSETVCVIRAFDMDTQQFMDTATDPSIIVKIVENGKGGYAYDYTQNHAIQHGNEDNVENIVKSLDFRYTVTDGDGDTAHNTLRINVIDDAPLAQHDLAAVTFSVDDQCWHAGGNVLTSQGSAFTAENKGEAESNGSPAWVKTGTNEPAAYTDMAGADGARVTKVTYVDEKGETQEASIPEGGSVELHLQGGGTLTMHSNGNYVYTAPATYPPSEATVSVIFEDALDTQRFSFTAYKSISTEAVEGGLPSSLTLAELAGMPSANLVYNDHAISVSSGRSDDRVNTIDGTSANGEGVLIDATSVYFLGLTEMRITLGDYSGTEVARIAVFDVDGNRLDDCDISWNGNTVTITNDAGIGQVLVVADNTGDAQTQFTITAISGTHEVANHDIAISPLEQVTYTITDGDGDSSTAILRFENIVDNLVIGSDQHDIDGSETPFTVPSDQPYASDHGVVQGSVGDDILVGDPTGVFGSGTKNYNICIILDTSGSMADDSGTPGKTRLDIAKESLEKLLQDLSEYEGIINVKLVTFQTTATGAIPAVLELNNNNYKNELDKLITTINGLAATGGTNYDQAFLQALTWFNALPAADNPDYINKVLFLTDGNPTYYSSGAGYGTGSTTNQATFNASYDSFQNLINNGKGIEVSAIGIGSGASGLSEDVLKFFDNTTENGFLAIAASGATVVANNTPPDTLRVEGRLYGEVTIVDKKEDLDAELARSLKIEAVGCDVILGGAGDDLIFGDVMNTDKLLADMLSQGHSELSGLPMGSGWAVFAALEEAGTWTRAETMAYIQTHAEELSKPLGVAQGGHDLIVGGSGNDTIYGQDGNDVIFGGNVHYNGQHGDAALDSLFAAAQDYGAPDASLAEKVAGYLQQGDNIHMLGQGDASDGNNVIHGGDGNNILIGGGGDDTFYVGSGDNLLFGGGGNDTFVWKPADFGGTDTIADFQHDFTTNKGDVLRFDALFSDSDNQHNALDALLSQAKWDGDTHTIKAGEGPVTISMTLAADHAELTVTDHGATQNIILNGDFSHFDLQAMNDQAAQQLLHDIIKVTG